MVEDKKIKSFFFFFYDLVPSGQIQASCSPSLCDLHFRGFITMKGDNVGIASPEWRRAYLNVAPILVRRLSRPSR